MSANMKGFYAGHATTERDSMTGKNLCILLIECDTRGRHIAAGAIPWGRTSRKNMTVPRSLRGCRKASWEISLIGESRCRASFMAPCRYLHGIAVGMCGASGQRYLGKTKQCLQHTNGRELPDPRRHLCLSGISHGL